MGAIERHWQEKWANDKTFEAETPKSEKSSGKHPMGKSLLSHAHPLNRRKYLITVPWPYTSGPLHVGHARTYSIADFIARYKRLSGFNVMFPMGFHESGTPILAISQRLKRGDQKVIDLYTKYISEYEEPENIPKILETFKDQEKLAAYFAGKIRKDFDSLGFSIDWSREFKSVDPVYSEFVSWQFRKLHNLGYITRGKYPILYNVDEESAVGEDDIEDGDTEKVSIEEFTSIIFEGEDYGIAASTLRAETLPGVVNLWVAPESNYVLCELNSRKVVMSESAKDKLSRQENIVKVIGRISSDVLTHKVFRNPLNNAELKVYEAEFVDPDNATGIVASVPSNSIIDYLECKKKGMNYASIQFIRVGGKYSTAESFLVEKKGNVNDPESVSMANSELYKVEFYEGVMDYPGFKDKRVSEARDEISKTMKEKGNAFTFYETSRKALTRSGSRVTVAVLSNQWFIDYSNKEWKNKSHETIEKMNFYPPHYKKGMNEVIDWLRERPCARMRGLGTRLPFDEKWIIESLSDSTIYPAVYTCIDSLRRIYESKGRIDDSTMDAIFTDSGNTDDKDALAARKAFNYWYGVDLRITAFPHFTNHLAFYIMNHSALLPEFAQPGGIMIAGTMVSNGKKISKSKGNAISLLQVSRDYGADLYRLYVAVTSDPTSAVDWNESDVAAVAFRFEELKKVISEAIDQRRNNNNPISDWFIESFYLHMKKYRENMDALSIRLGFIEIFYGVLNDISKVRSKGLDPYRSIMEIVNPWLKALSPIIPHFAEEMWHKGGKDSYISREIFSVGDLREPNMVPIENEAYLDNIISDIREVIKLMGRKPQNITILTCSDNTGIMVEKALKGESITNEMKWMIPLVMKNRKFIKMGIDEKTVLVGAIDYLKQIFSCEFQVNEDSIEGNQKRVALPGKPLIKLA
ncbi:MAG: leucine--tRNA ligase [Thermoplasmataceae archaeon]